MWIARDLARRVVWALCLAPNRLMELARLDSASRREGKVRGIKCRATAAKALGGWRARRWTRALNSVLRADADGRMKKAAAEGLAEIASDEAIDCLLQRLRDRDSGTRIYAAAALARTRSARAVLPLIEAFEGTMRYGRDRHGRGRWYFDANVTRTMAPDLAACGDVRALAPLIAYLRIFNHMEEHRDLYPGYDSIGVRLWRLDALRAIEQFAHSCQAVPDGWTKMRLRITERHEWTYPGESLVNVSSLSADLDLPVCVDEASAVSRDKVLHELRHIRWEELP